MLLSYTMRALQLLLTSLSTSDRQLVSLVDVLHSHLFLSTVGDDVWAKNMVYALELCFIFNSILVVTLRKYTFSYSIFNFPPFLVLLIVKVSDSHLN
jgi:hypothetical protein